MARFLLRRLALAIGITLLVLVALSAAVRIVPGDAATAMLRERATPQLVAQVRESMGLDLPISEQVARFVSNVIRGDLGTDFFSNRPVAALVSEALPHTAILAIVSMAAATLIAIPVAVISASRPGSWLDQFLAFASVSAISIPPLVAGLVLLILFGVQLDLFPIIGTGEFEDPVGYLHHLVLPTVALALGWIGYLARLLRTSLVEVMETPYIRAARAFGVRERVIFYRYALKNAFIPTMAVVGYGTASLLGGALFVEIIFTRRGVGTLLADAISTRNYVVVQGTVAVVSILFVLFNLLVDIAYRLVDPRVRLERTEST